MTKLILFGILLILSRLHLTLGAAGHAATIPMGLVLLAGLAVLLHAALRRTRKALRHIW